MDDMQTPDHVNTDDKIERIVNRLTNKNVPFSMPNQLKSQANFWLHVFLALNNFPALITGCLLSGA